MKRSRFAEEQIIAVLPEREAGISSVEARRKHEISSATFYAWKAKFGGMEAPEAKRLKQLEDVPTNAFEVCGVNAKPKRLLADAMLDNAALKDLLAERILTPAAKREAVAHLAMTYEMSERPGVPPDQGPPRRTA